MLRITEDEVQRLLPMQDALREVEAGLRALGEGKAENRPRQRVRGAHAILNVMVGSWPERGYYGFKYYTASKQGIRFWFHLFDGETGELLAVLEANRLGQRRTGAASGILTKLLARRDAATVGLIGTGWQAESQLEAVCAVRRIAAVRCVARSGAHAKAFEAMMSKTLGVEVTAVNSNQETVQSADIVIAATSSAEPVVRGTWLGAGAHINAMGANRIESRELDNDAIRLSTLIVADSVEQAKAEAGDLVQPVQDGFLSWNQVLEAGAVVSGRAAGRRSDDDITLFKSLGIAIEDLAVAAFVYERAKRDGAGREQPL